MNAGRAAVGSAWSLLLMEVAMLGVLALPAQDAEAAQLAVLALVIGLVSAGVAAWVHAAPAGRAAFALAAGAVAALLAGASLAVLRLLEGGAFAAFSTLGGLWLAATIAALWRSRESSPQQRVWFWAGIAGGIIGFVTLPNLGAHIVSRAGGDALAGILVLGAPAFAAFPVLGAVLVAPIFRRLRRVDREVAA